MFSKNRHGRFRDSGALRHVFESVLRRCMNEGLVEGEGFALDARVVKADANRAREVAGADVIDWRQGDAPSRAVQEYLTALEAQNPAPGDDAEPTAAPKRISLTDPAARYTAAPGGPAFFAYSTNYLIDLHAGIIVDVEATPAHRTQEVESTKTMVDRVQQRFNLKPKRLVSDTAYGTGAMLGWMVQEKRIEPMCLSGSARPEAMARSKIATFGGSSRLTNIAAQLGTPCVVTGDSAKSRARALRRPIRSSIDRVSPTATHAR